MNATEHGAARYTLLLHVHAADSPAAGTEPARSVTVLDTDLVDHGGPLVDIAAPTGVVRVEFADAPVRAAILVHSISEIGCGSDRLVRLDGHITEIFSTYDDHQGFPLAEPCALIADANAWVSRRVAAPVALHAE